MIPSRETPPPTPRIPTPPRNPALPVVAGEGYGLLRTTVPAAWTGHLTTDMRCVTVGMRCAMVVNERVTTDISRVTPVARRSTHDMRLVTVVMRPVMVVIARVTVIISAVMVGIRRVMVGKPRKTGIMHRVMVGMSGSTTIIPAHREHANRGQVKHRPQDRGPPRPGTPTRGPPRVPWPNRYRPDRLPLGGTGRSPSLTGVSNRSAELTRTTRMSILVKGTSRLNAIELAAKAEYIVERMTDNPAFPDPIPTLAEITLATGALRTAITNALDGGKTDYAIKRMRQKELRLLVNQLAGYVSSVAEGNELAILSSGFPVRKPGKPAPEPAMPMDVRAYISDHTGRVDLTWAAVNPAVTYHIQWTAGDPTDEKAWSLIAVSTRSSTKVTGLPSGQLSHFRVAGIGTKGMGPWSQVVSTLVR